jgi:ParB-like chromosome segregation protein Spo0J
MANLAVAGLSPYFVKDTAERTGESERSIRRDIERAEAISPTVKDLIASLPQIADKGVELDALAAMKPEEQQRAVEAVREGKAKSVRGANVDPPRRVPAAPKPAMAPPSREELARAVQNVAESCFALLETEPPVADVARFAADSSASIENIEDARNYLVNYCDLYYRRIRAKKE